MTMEDNMINDRLFIPEKYAPLLGVLETERAIRAIKGFFQDRFEKKLSLMRVTAPLFVRSGTGINDDLNGLERPVAFAIKDDCDARAEIVHSLAKWKRMALATHRLPRHKGLYTDMNAIRPDETLDNLHSIYVDQWDWEMVISKADRKLSFLKNVVGSIYLILREAERFVHRNHKDIKPVLPPKITFVHSEELEALYPALAPRERENEVCRKWGAVFVIGIGHKLAGGAAHDGRAPDYDDWSTPTPQGRHGLNGDILVWNPVLGRAFEISSMGIRVDQAALERQLEIAGCPERKELLFHKKLLAGELPLSIGGGIGQSRLCMFLLRKAHIGEVQSSIWPAWMVEECGRRRIFLM